MTKRKPWRHASASQIKTFDRCRRKWWFDKIAAGIVPPTSPGAEFGKKVHAAIEGRLTTGNWTFDAGDVDGLRVREAAHALYASLPVRRAPPQHVEYAAKLTHTTLPVPIIGYVDLAIPDRRIIIDHKTTKNFRYCRTSKQLMADPQAIIYGIDAVLRWDGPDCDEHRPVHFWHKYVHTKTFATSETLATLTPDVLMRGFADIAQTTKAMHGYALADASDVPYNSRACRDFGGCPFLSRCHALGDRGSGMVNALYRATAPGEVANMSWRDKIKQHKNKTGKSEVPALADPAQENPPDGVPDGVAAAPTTEGVPTWDGKKLSNYSVAEIRAIHAHIVGRLTDDQLRAYHDATKLGGKPKKADWVVDAALVMRLHGAAGQQNGYGATVRYDLPTEPVAPKEPAEVTHERAPNHSVTLYVGCMPRGVGAEHFDVMIKPLQDRVAETEGVIFYSAVPYNAGPGKVAALLAKAIREGEMTLPAHLVVNPRLPCSDKCLEVLIPLANRIVERI